MAGALTTAAPAANNTVTANQTTVPTWYSDFIQNILTRGADIAAQGRPEYGGQRVAGFSPLQTQAFQTIQNNAGGWQAPLAQAQGALTQIMPQVRGAVTNANNAVSGPAPTWNAQTAQQYMSPYTSGVVDEIARLGNRNFTENIMPQINGGFISSGQFGSGRNAEILGRAARDTQADITGRQASALESGYSTAANIFGADANRTQQQGQIQANTALGGGQLFSNAGTNTAGALNTIAGNTQNFGLADANALLTAGGLQQNQQQRGLDLAYQDFQDQTGYDMGMLNQMRNLLQGVTIPTGNTTVTNGTTTGGGASPLAWLMSIINQRGG